MELKKELKIIKINQNRYIFLSKRENIEMTEQELKERLLKFMNFEKLAPGTTIEFEISAKITN